MKPPKTPQQAGGAKVSSCELPIFDGFPFFMGPNGSENVALPAGQSRALVRVRVLLTADPVRTSRFADGESFKTGDVTYKFGALSEIIW